MVQIVNELGVLRQLISNWKRQGLRIALVPTMGNLHDGHYSLMKLARQHADKVVTSIFVNPTQFAVYEDLDRYPRTLDADIVGLGRMGCDAVWLPSVETMYPLGVQKTTIINVPGLSEKLEGAHRPSHFNGVCTVVVRLFLQVQPDVAIFGRKDYQQLAIIRQIVTELSFPIQTIGAETIRDEDGLAKSSRNQFLTTKQRSVSTVIYRTLLGMRESYAAGDTRECIETNAIATLQRAGFQVDYAVLCTPELDVPNDNGGERVALIAATLGTTRLIDNLEFS